MGGRGVWNRERSLVRLPVTVGAIAAWLIGCSGADPGGESGGTRVPTSNPSAAAGGTSASAGGSGASLSGDNSTWDPSMIVNNMPPDAGCVEGERCYEGAAPDDDNCGTVELKAKVETIEHPGNVLLVFDTSFSMTENWNTGPRFQIASQAVINALTPLQDLLTIGSLFFPRADPNTPLTCDPFGLLCLVCAVTPIASADQIDFKPGADFLTAFNTPVNGVAPYTPVMDAMGYLGATPLKEALMQAQAALAAATLEGLTSVVVITDGDPNCAWDPDGPMVTQQIVADWLAMGIRTHVIGLPGTTGAGDTILTNLAVTGGTMTYITPTDSATLEMKLREIATETVQMGFETCTFELDPPAEVPDKLLMIVEENGMRQNVPHMAGPDAGWTISADGKMVDISGVLCDDATGGRFSSITFEFGCPDVPPPPTLPPVI
jgi:hypothetical protein